MALFFAASEPAGGAALDQVAIATGMAGIATAVLMIGILGYRKHPGQDGPLRRLAAFSERVSGLPGWAALPLGVGGGSLLIALLGMYWDISLHIDQGRDPGPLANPAHYLILVGLYGVFASGCLALALPEEKPGPAAIKITRDWYVPVGGVLTAACGGFALLGFPLDDMWHRIFGQDVTLWGPTHLMLFGGAGLTLIGQAILLAEGLAFRGVKTDRLSDAQLMVALRRVGLMGGLLIGLSTFQGEFDFGVPQFRMVFHPMLIALAAGMALTAARVWIGKGGALATALMFLAVRGAIAFIVGDVFGESSPTLPLYLAEALCVEAAGLALGRNRPIALGVVGGVLCGTVGLAVEWLWVGAVFPLPWSDGIVPEALIVTPIAGATGGVLGGLLGAGLRFQLPSPAAARTAAIAAFVAIAALTAYGLSTTKPAGQTATVSLRDDGGDAAHRHVVGTVRLSPRDTADDATWVTVTSWQSGGMKVDRLKRVGEGVYELRTPAPVYGDWKTVLRVQNGRSIMGVPIYMPADSAIPGAKLVPASAHFTRPFVADHELLQRERKDDIPGWLWTVACLVVLALSLIFMASLAWGVARVARASGDGTPTGAPPAQPTRTAGDREGRFASGGGRVASAPGS
ncbi:hypothetical protein DSM104299_01213 [Baekduia alba]|uniref:hypothetical protein n=1 Tax=Baekduia alba TaxID=2997333 RepID=UPI00233FC6B4|nr:hypothetical protein [Baekduia alba]WCB92517.1 hypothetical protein DSM104299_01213 [Baekduia alba]